MNCKNNTVRPQIRFFAFLCTLLLGVLPSFGADAPASIATEDAEDAGQLDDPEIRQTVLLSGTRNVRFSIQAPLEVRKDREYALVTEKGAIHPLRLVGDSPFGRPVFELAAVPPLNATCSLSARAGGDHYEPLQRAVVRFIPKFRILLSFDDGPASGQNPADGVIESSPTWKVLQALDAFRHGPDNSRQGIKAIFFLLTQPDRFLRDMYPKGETADGAALMREEAKRGHILGVHWGGRYGGQTVTHPKRVLLPAYDYTGNAGASRGFGDNALESDLLECIDRIHSVTSTTPHYVRPPLWKYSDGKNPATEKAVLDTYARLGLKMILTDARYPDGGYAVIAAFIPNPGGTFRKNLHTAFQGGEDTLIFSMHDSNSFTANRLPDILCAIRDDFEKERFGGQGGKAADYLDFADSTAEVEEILQSKTHFTLFPEYAPPHEAPLPSGK